MITRKVTKRYVSLPEPAPIEELRRKVETPHWQDKVYYATRGSQLGAIIECALERGGHNTLPRFAGKAIVTSDGFLQCNFYGANGDYHPGAFIGRVSDLSRNIELLADELNLCPADEEALTAAITGWIETDYRS